MALADVDAVRRELAAFGKRRKTNEAKDREMTEEIKQAIVRADEVGVSVADQARLLQVHRTTLYRVYKVKR